MTNSMISIGNEIDAEQKRGTDTLKGTEGKVGKIITIVPTVDTLISKIKCRKYKNGIIIGAVIAVMTFLMYLLR